MRSWSDFTLQEKALLTWGKARRFYLVHFRPGYVARSIARRQGECHRTGACCNLLFTCPIYAAKPLPTCRVHDYKPKVCKIFPIDERDLSDRDIISPEVPCGFSFTPAVTVSSGPLPNVPK
jgi:hypothetical protein